MNWHYLDSAGRRGREQRSRGKRQTVLSLCASPPLASSRVVRTSREHVTDTPVASTAPRVVVAVNTFPTWCDQTVTPLSQTWKPPTTNLSGTRWCRQQQRTSRKHVVNAGCAMSETDASHLYRTEGHARVRSRWRVRSRPRQWCSPKLAPRIQGTYCSVGDRRRPSTTFLAVASRSGLVPRPWRARPSWPAAYTVM